MTAGYNTISLGTGRKEFNPKKPRPGIEYYLKEAGQGVLTQIKGGADSVDESILGNFMAARFNKQANLPGFFPMIDKKLEYKPATSVEGACGSGGLSLQGGIRSVLAETADVVLSMGVEVQNTVKAIYGADILAGAGWYQERKKVMPISSRDNLATERVPIMKNTIVKELAKEWPSGTPMPLKMRA